MDIRLETLKALLDIADKFYRSGLLPEKTAAVYLYLNIVEEITVFLIYEIQIENNKQSIIKIKINDEYLEKITIGQKIMLLKQFEFYNSNETIELLEKINKDRITVVHKLLSCLVNKQVDETIERLCKNCIQLREEFAKILRHNLKK